MKTLIDQAYACFQQYRVAAIKNVCTVCCVSPEEVGVLLNVDVHHLDSRILSAYNDAAQAEQPDINEFKHFLPRYLELINAFDFPSHSVELSLRNIGFYHRSSWTNDEWDILEAFKQQFFKKYLVSFLTDSYSDLTSVLIMFDLAGMEVESLLSEWQKNESLAACLHYKMLVLYNIDWNGNRKFRNAFAKDKLAERLVAWAEEPKVKERFKTQVEQVILQEKISDEKELKELSWLYDMI